MIPVHFIQVIKKKLIRLLQLNRSLITYNFSTSTYPVKSKKISSGKHDLRLVILYLAGSLLLTCHILPFENYLTSWDSPSSSRVFWNGFQLELGDQKNNSDTPLVPAAIAPLLFNPLPINDADFNLLVSLVGVGPQLATEIIEARTRFGPFLSGNDLLKIKGIGKGRMKNLMKQVTF